MHGASLYDVESFELALVRASLFRLCEVNFEKFGDMIDDDTEEGISTWHTACAVTPKLLCHGGAGKSRKEKRFQNHLFNPIYIISPHKDCHPHAPVRSGRYNRTNIQRSRVPGCLKRQVWA